MLLNTDEFENARQMRDPRFDGRFFVGVLTTGIYCRPICPVRVPKKENVQLYESAAAAAEAGFRPCLRCRPESSPGTPAWSGTSWKVSRALQLIDQGFLDDHSVGELAEQLAVGPRQLSRLFQDHLGASPVAVAQTRRLHFAKKLIDETRLNFSEICFAAGFGSVRRFNSLFSKTYSRSPRQLREARSVNRNQLNEGGAIELSLSYRPPFDCEAMLGFLAYRAIPGVEAVTERSYARTFRLEGLAGHFQAFFEPRSHNIRVRVSYGETRHLDRIIERIRALFDVRADSAQIDEFLVQDSQLAPMVRRFPGLRVPGCWSGYEVAVRAILGQQVTVKAASTLVARVAERYGDAYECDVEGLSALSQSRGRQSVSGFRHRAPENQIRMRKSIGVTERSHRYVLRGPFTDALDFANGRHKCFRVHAAPDVQLATLELFRDRPDSRSARTNNAHTIKIRLH